MRAGQLLRGVVVLSCLAAGAAHIGPGAASADDVKAGTLTILHPWSRATPSGAKTAAGYAVIQNVGGASDRLIGVAVDAAAKVTAHSMSMDGDIMKMRDLPDGIVIPANGSVALKPGSFHLMFEGLKHPLKAGDSVSGTLTFEKAGAVPVSFKVEPLGATDPDGGMKGMKMD